MTTTTNKLIDIDREFDDVVFDETKILQRTATLLNHENPEFRKNFLEGRKKYVNNKEWSELHSNITKKLFEDYDHIKKHQDGVEKRTQKPEWKISQQKAGEKRKNNPSFKINMKAGKEKSELYQKTFKEKCERFKVPFMTRHGAFESKKDAGIFYDVDVAMIGYWIKKYPNEFYKISKEEYEKIKHIPNLTIDENNPHPRKKKK
jgi:hypothetical protein